MLGVGCKSLTRPRTGNFRTPIHYNIGIKASRLRAFKEDYCPVTDYRGCPGKRLLPSEKHPLLGKRNGAKKRCMFLEIALGVGENAPGVCFPDKIGARFQTHRHKRQQCRISSTQCTRNYSLGVGTPLRVITFNAYCCRYLTLTPVIFTLAGKPVQYGAL